MKKTDLLFIAFLIYACTFLIGWEPVANNPSSSGASNTAITPRVNPAPEVFVCRHAKPPFQTYVITGSKESDPSIDCSNVKDHPCKVVIYRDSEWAGYLPGDTLKLLVGIPSTKTWRRVYPDQRVINCNDVLPSRLYIYVRK